MKPLPRMISVEVVIQGVLKIVWNDGYAGVVDLRPVIDRGRIFTYLQSPDNFSKVQLEEYGHSIGWIDNEGHEIDLGADNLREKAENQARLIKVISEIHI